MRLFASSISLAAVLLSAGAQEVSSPETPMEAPANPSPRQAALERVLTERETPAAFRAALAEARKQGISEQALLEARFLYHVDRSEDDAIIAMLPDFLKRREQFRLEDSEIFQLPEDWEAVIEYVQALDASKKGDKEAFKKHITEAFWLSPGQAAAFAPYIERMRVEEAMRAVKIDFAAKLVSLTGDQVPSLQQVLGENKALLLHFWSPWSRECEVTFPDFVASALELQTKGIAVLSLLPEDTAEVVADARAMLKPLGLQPPGSWVIDRKQSPFHQQLRIQNFPTMVLISPEGAVLFHGHPGEDGLWDALHAVNAEIQRPAVPE